jgi:hypothetical protein
LLLTLAPHKAIPLYESGLRDWPATRVRARGVHQARLAVACAATGELDRAKAEGRRAWPSPSRRRARRLPASCGACATCWQPDTRRVGGSLLPVDREPTAERVPVSVPEQEVEDVIRVATRAAPAA